MPIQRGQPNLSVHDTHAGRLGVVAKYYRYDRSNTGPYYK